MDKNIKKIIAGAAIAAGAALTYFLVKRRNASREQHHLKSNPQSLIRKVMHKSKEAVV
ncbi:MAG: hypothetical protein ABJB86_07215 [Bacteroidota bacterium]